MKINVDLKLGTGFAQGRRAGDCFHAFLPLATGVVIASLATTVPTHGVSAISPCRWRSGCMASFFAPWLALPIAICTPRASAALQPLGTSIPGNGSLHWAAHRRCRNG